MFPEDKNYYYIVEHQPPFYDIVNKVSGRFVLAWIPSHKEAVGWKAVLEEQRRLIEELNKD